MTPEEEVILKRFETRTRQLIFEYQELKTENELLKEDMASMKQELDQIKKDYANLKMARMIEISDQEMKDAKSRINRLVRDLDRCIALLKV